MSEPEVDVIVCTYNRQQRVAQTLRSLDRQIQRGFRVLVVDDGSTPPLAETLPQEFLGRDDIQLLSTGGNRGPAAARNLALHCSHADLIAFIDDDVDADPRWLAAHLARYRSSPEHTIVIGPLLAPHDWKPTAWNRWEAHCLAREYRRMERGEYEPNWQQFFTGNALAPRADLVSVGGFNESFTRAEDIELGLRLARAGCGFVFEPGAKGWHYAHRSVESWLGNAERYARFDAEMDRMYPDLRWLETIRSALATRSRASAVVRGAVTGCMGERGAVSFAVLAAKVLNRRPFATLAVHAASLAYDIRLRSAMARLDSLEAGTSELAASPQSGARAIDG